MGVHTFFITDIYKNESSRREQSFNELRQFATLFGMSVDQILNYDGNMPEELRLEEKHGFEQLAQINQLEDDDKQTVLKIIDTMITKKKFKRVLSEECGYTVMTIP